VSGRSRHPGPRLSFEAAIEMILAHSRHGRRTAELPIQAAAEFALAEEIRSTVDMPPFDRAAMDGFAFRHADPTPTDGFRVVASIAAGKPSSLTRPLARGECAKIMTGAPVPDGADTVIPVEDTSGFQSIGELVHFRAIPSRGMHIAPRGQDLASGATVLEEGRLLHAQEIALLATMGRGIARAYAGPTIAFAATGDELREPGEATEFGGIHNSNAYSLWSQILASHSTPQYLGIVRDELPALRSAIARGLEADILVLSGGISMGEHDHVPAVLEELGVRILFRKVRVRPGQPTLFGLRESGERGANGSSGQHASDGGGRGAGHGGEHRTLVFGLPGNPISTLFAFDQYVLPAVRSFRGHPSPLTPLYHGRLTEDVKKRIDYLTLTACRSEWDGEGFRLQPLVAHGSADLFAIRGADVLALLPEALDRVPAGTTVPFRRLYQP
jgi:molybdopterin molybdotransferase